MAWFKRKEKKLKNPTKKSIPDGLWGKCPSCGEIIYKPELEKNLSVCHHCNHHFRVPPEIYKSLLIDEGSDKRCFENIKSIDFLGFKAKKAYKDQILDANKKTKEYDAIQVFEGERQMTMHNNKLGEFNLTGIPPMPRGMPQIEVTYDIDANGILSVNSTEKSSGKTEKITVTNDKGRLSQEDIDRMVQEAEQFKEDDDKIKQQVESKNQFDGLVYQSKTYLENDNLNTDDKEAIKTRLDEEQLWIDSNQHSSKEDYDAKHHDLQQFLSQYATKLTQDSTEQSQQYEKTPPNTEEWTPNIDDVD